MPHSRRSAGAAVATVIYSHAKAESRKTSVQTLQQYEDALHENHVRDGRSSSRALA